MKIFKINLTLGVQSGTIKASMEPLYWITKTNYIKVYGKDNFVISHSFVNDKTSG